MSASSPGHVLVIGVDGVRFDLLGPGITPAIWALDQDGFLAPVRIDALAADRRVARLLAAVRSRPSQAREDWTVVVVTDHGHLDQDGHGGREPEVATAWAAAAGPGIRPGAPPLITRQAQVAPLVLDAVGSSPGPG